MLCYPINFEFVFYWEISQQRGNESTKSENYSNVCTHSFRYSVCLFDWRRKLRENYKIRVKCFITSESFCGNPVRGKFLFSFCNAHTKAGENQNHVAIHFAGFYTESNIKWINDSFSLYFARHIIRFALADTRDRNNMFSFNFGPQVWAAAIFAEYEYIRHTSLDHNMVHRRLLGKTFFILMNFPFRKQ